MRKALIGLILAGTVMMPAAVQAQRDHDGGNGHNDRGETHAARVQERQAQQAQQAQQGQHQQVQRQAPQAQIVERQRGDGGNRGGNNAGGNFQGRNDGGNRGNGQGANRQGSIYPQAWQGNPNDPRLRHYQELERRNQQGGNDRGNWRGDNRGGRTNWNRGWRNDNRYDWQRYRNGNRGRFHLGPYYSPYRGYGYNRFSIGIFLDPFFYDQRYWIGDPWQYRLPPAEPGTEWVRYYDDVLLVDVDTGEVLDTIYDFFW